MKPEFAQRGTPEVRATEECAELISVLATAQHAITKAVRFGWDSFHPAEPKVTNLDRLRAAAAHFEEEVADVRRLFEELVAHAAQGPMAPLPVPPPVVVKPVFTYTSTARNVGRTKEVGCWTDGIGVFMEEPDPHFPRGTAYYLKPGRVYKVSIEDMGPAPKKEA